MNKPSFVYVIYIQSTPEKVFGALTDPEMTKDYWGRHRNVSDWKPGSEWRHEDYDDETSVAVQGTVIERNPPRLLVLSWVRPAHLSDPEKTSRVTFELEEQHGSVRLMVTHEDLDSEMLKGVSAGWPAILSSLKSMLETGASMPMTRRQWKSREPSAESVQA